MSLTRSIRIHALRCLVAAFVLAGDAHTSNAVGVGWSAVFAFASRDKCNMHFEFS